MTCECKDCQREREAARLQRETRAWLKANSPGFGVFDWEDLERQSAAARTREAEARSSKTGE